MKLVDLGKLIVKGFLIIFYTNMRPWFIIKNNYEELIDLIHHKHLLKKNKYFYYFEMLYVKRLPF